MRPAGLLLAALLAACAGARPEPSISYRCEDGTRLIARFPTPDQLMLDQGGLLIRMERVVAASGARYADAQRTFWTRPDGALYETSRGMTRCAQVAR